MVHASRFLALVSVLCLAACSSGGSTTDDSSEGALERNSNAQTTETLLRCNVFESGGGPDQEVIVKRSGDSLTLEELTNHGSTVRRDLSEEEWSSHVIQLRKEYPDEVNTLTKEGRSWRNESKGGGMRVIGYADCSIDKTN